jgi:hypothetical protein
VRRRELDILYVATRAAVLFLLPLYISDTGLYQEYARRLLEGHQLPYAHWDFEYPPLAYPLMLVPGWLADTLGLRATESYRLLFGFLLLPFDFLLYRAFLRRPPFGGAAFAYVLLTTAMGLLLFDRFDIAVGFLAAWPFLAGDEAPDLRFSLSWGLGGALKLVPLLLAPARLLDWAGPWRERAPRLFRFVAVVALPTAVSVALAALLAHGKVSFLSRNADRGVQIESLLGSGVMFVQAFTNLVKVSVDWNFGAQHLGPLKGLVPASRALFYGMLAATYFQLWAEKRSRGSLAAAWLLLSGFVTFGYVLSPQFLLWLIPLGLCAAARVPEGARRSAWVAVFAAAVALTGVHFRFYWDYVNLHPWSVAMVLTRNLLLLALWGLSWAWMSAPEPSAKT